MELPGTIGPADRTGLISSGTAVPGRRADDLMLSVVIPARNDAHNAVATLAD